jgi:NADP-dependent 3-hydroxy acid dehydrogenase YdfG
VVIARDPAQLEAAANSMPGQVTSQATDVTDNVELTRAVIHLIQRFGPCDVLVATAGAARPGYHRC